MKTLRMFTIGILVAAAAGASTAAEEPIPTITVAAKHHAVAVERVAPDASIDKTPFVMPTDMPEAEIHYQLAPIAAAHSPRPSHE